MNCTEVVTDKWVTNYDNKNGSTYNHDLDWHNLPSIVTAVQVRKIYRKLLKPPFHGNRALDCKQEVFFGCGPVINSVAL